MKPLGIAKMIGKLKKLKRTGWVMEGIEQGESVADHSFRTAILAMVLAPHAKVDKVKVVKMALIHDVGESEVGDVVWFREKPDHAKRLKKEKGEKEAMKRIFKEHPEYIELFDELLERKTEEAQFIWQIDVIERLIQAHEYEKEHGKDLSLFFRNGVKKITHPELKKLLDDVLKKRSK